MTAVVAGTSVPCAQAAINSPPLQPPSTECMGSSGGDGLANYVAEISSPITWNCDGNKLEKQRLIFRTPINACCRARFSFVMSDKLLR